MTIYKYSLDVTSIQYLELPANAEFLTLQLQYDKPTLWVRLGTKASTVTRKIVMYGTGHNMDLQKESKYIGTVQLHGLVWHYFEEFDV